MAENRDDLIELDACLARVPMPDGLEARIVAATTVRTVGPSPMRRSLVVGLAFATGVAVTVVSLRGWLSRPDSDATISARSPSLEPSLEPEPDRVVPIQPAPGLSLISETCEWSRTDELLHFPAGCRIRLAQPAMDLEIWAPTQLSPITDGVAVREGVVMFSVEHVEDPEHPARVGVSGGTIEVLGTRFAVHQARDDGHVDLIDGAIRFRRLDGDVDAIEPGLRYHWSSPTVDPSDVVEQPQPRDRDLDLPEPAPASTLDEDLAEVARLRRAGEFEAAIAKLDALAHEQSDARTLEVISYERGTLIERSTTAATACESWFAHRRNFPSGRYDAEIERRLEQLQCVPK